MIKVITSKKYRGIIKENKDLKEKMIEVNKKSVDLVCENNSLRDDLKTAACKRIKMYEEIEEIKVDLKVKKDVVKTQAEYIEKISKEKFNAESALNKIQEQLLQMDKSVILKEIKGQLFGCIEEAKTAAMGNGLSLIPGFKDPRVIIANSKASAHIEYIKISSLDNIADKLKNIVDEEIEKIEEAFQVHEEEAQNIIDKKMDSINREIAVSFQVEGEDLER